MAARTAAAIVKELQRQDQARTRRRRAAARAVAGAMEALEEARAKRTERVAALREELERVLALEQEKVDARVGRAEAATGDAVRVALQDFNEKELATLIGVALRHVRRLARVGRPDDSGPNGEPPGRESGGHRELTQAGLRVEPEGAGSGVGSGQPTA